MNKLEQEAAGRADAQVAEKNNENKDPGADFKFVEGAPLPDGFVNPKPGEDFHRCVDLANKYAPDWFALILYRVDQQEPNNQFFAGGVVSRKGRNRREKYRLDRGVWCDVPPFIETECRVSVDQVMDMRPVAANPDNLGLTTAAMAPVVVSEKQKFHYLAKKSA